MARRVLVPPMSPARTCIVPGTYPTGGEDQATARRSDAAPPLRASVSKPTFITREIDMRIFCVVAAALVATGARAQLVETSINATGDNNWSATAGRTVGNGNSVLQAEVGWPGVGFTYLKGANETSDIGFHVGFNYGFEGTTNTVVGLNLAVPYRHLLGMVGDTAIAFRTDPG